MHHYNTEIIKHYNVIEYIPGHIIKGDEKNPIWIINDNGLEKFLMYCETNTLCILCRDSYQKILDFEKYERKGKKFFWGKKDKNNNKVKYIRAGHNGSTIYIHQVIMNFYGNGSGTKDLSIDHIDRNPLNNQMNNLRIATSKEQHENSKGIIPNTKKDRRNDARELPNGILQEDIPKYITYVVMKYGKKNEFKRECFKIESHPLINKIWVSTTKNGVSIQEKLQQTKYALDYFNKNGKLPDTPDRELPQYVSYYKEADKHLLVWQKKVDEKRLSKRITLNCDYFELDKELQSKELDRLNINVIKKYKNKYSIYQIDDEKLIEIQDEIDSELPMYIRTQKFQDGLYLIYSRHKGIDRISMSSKLPPNYNINKELHIFNKKITENHGEGFGINLENFPYNEDDDKIEIPEGLYISLKCKNPYIFMKKDQGTVSMNLPEKYNLKEQIDIFKLPENQVRDELYNIEKVKELFSNGMKPENISICFKDGKYYQLQYKAKTKEYRHDKTFTLPKENININLQLLKMNDHIINIYGKEFSIFMI